MCDRVLLENCFFALGRVLFRKFCSQTSEQTTGTVGSQGRSRVPHYFFGGSLLFCAGASCAIALNENAALEALKYTGWLKVINTLNPGLKDSSRLQSRVSAEQEILLEYERFFMKYGTDLSFVRALFFSTSICKMKNPFF